MRIEYAYLQGTAVPPEDRMAVVPEKGIFGVFDGQSAPYTPKEGPLIYCFNLSGGAAAAEALMWACMQANPAESLDDIIFNANFKLRRFHESFKLSTMFDGADKLAGTSFVCIEMNNDSVKIVQGGDCLAVWRLESGQFGATKNFAYAHDIENQAIISELLEKNGHDKQKTWEEYKPILAGRKARDINNPKSEKFFAILNGQHSFEKCYQRYQINPVEELETILLFSDGLINYKDSADEMLLAKKVITRYEEAGISGLLADKKERNRKAAGTSYIDEEEASVIAISFT